MAQPRFSKATAERMAEIVSAQGVEQVSVHTHHTDSPQCYSIQRHNQFNDHLTSELEFGPDFAQSRNRFTAAEATLILAGMAHGIKVAKEGGR